MGETRGHVKWMMNDARYERNEGANKIDDHRCEA